MKGDRDTCWYLWHFVLFSNITNIRCLVCQSVRSVDLVRWTEHCLIFFFPDWHQSENSSGNVHTLLFRVWYCILPKRVSGKCCLMRMRIYFFPQGIIFMAMWHISHGHWKIEILVELELLLCGFCWLLYEF